MVELLFPLTLREDMKDVFIHPRGLGLRGVWMVRKTSPVHVFILSELHISVNPQMGVPIWGLYTREHLTII